MHKKLLFHFFELKSHFVEKSNFDSQNRGKKVRKKRGNFKILQNFLISFYTSYTHVYFLPP